MAKDDPYRCLMPVRHDGRRYAAGADIALPEAAAAPLLAVPAITAAPRPKATRAAKPAAAAAGPGGEPAPKGDGAAPT